MALRTVFYLENNKIKSKEYTIDWNAGFSISQKQKNIRNLHFTISKDFNVSVNSILEVSTKSFEEIGRQLSSFNLEIHFNKDSYKLENLYQASKVFNSCFGKQQYPELLRMETKKTKKFLLENETGQLIEFNCLGRVFPLNPKNLFYDWLYIKSVSDIPDIYDKISKYSFFTDIEFNPEKSVSCQARSLVLYIWLYQNNKINDYLDNPEKFYPKY